MSDIGDVAKLADMIREAGPGRTLALTGAGISTPSGIPDFRSPVTGRWANVDPMTVAHADVLREDPERFWAFYRERLDIADGVEPNQAHLTLADMERGGWLSGVITQNIDGLHQKAGSERVVEMHGSIRTLSCRRCEQGVPRERAIEELFGSDGIPRCPDPICEAAGEPAPRAVLRPDVVLFGENLPTDAITDAYELIDDCALLICIGSSLVVNPVAGIPDLVRELGGKIALINATKTPLDDPDVIPPEIRLWGDLAIVASELSRELDD